MMLKYAGVDVDAQTIQFVNMRDKDAETIISEAGCFSCCAECNNMTYLESDPDWPSWYPVIDDSRCTNCGQCADFCLFGVYETIDEVVTVVNPDHCKNNCPACARICPETAIVFPKYPEGAISGSDDIDELAEQKRQQEDIQKILGSDINKSLQERKLKRQSIIKQGVMEKAIQEREQALKNK
jgi:ferredoxin